MFKQINPELIEVIQDHLLKSEIKSFEILSSLDELENSRANIFLINGETRYYERNKCLKITFPDGSKHEFYSNGQLAQIINRDGTGASYKEDGTIEVELVKFSKKYAWEGCPADKLCDPGTAMIHRSYLDNGNVSLRLHDNGVSSGFGMDNADGSSIRYSRSGHVHFDADGRRIRETYVDGCYSLFQKNGEIEYFEKDGTLNCIIKTNGDKEYFNKDETLARIIKANGTHEFYVKGELISTSTEEERDARAKLEREAEAAEARRPKLRASFGMDLSTDKTVISEVGSPNKQKVPSFNI